LRSLVCVESTRYDLTTGTTSIEKRYFISSLPGTDAAGMLAAIRGHWKIENQLHWSLDINYREDECRIRQGHAPEHFSRLKRLSQNMLKMDKSTRAGIHSKRLRCGWDHDYLLKILATDF